MKSALRSTLLKALIALPLIFSFSGAPAAADGVNVRVGALGLFIGILGVDVDFELDSNWTVGPTLSFGSFTIKEESSTFLEDYKVSFFQAGLRANWFKNGVFTDGLYIGPSATYTNVELKTRDSGGEVSADASALYISGLVGYGWFWENFNMMLGGGLSLSLGDSDITVRESNGTTTSVRSNPTGGLALEYTLGWVF